MKKIISKRKQKKLRKKLTILVILPIIILTSLLSTTVKAGSQDSNLIRNKIDGIYSVAPLSDRTHLYNLEIYTVNDKISYCIEIGKSINTNIYNSTLNLEEQLSITKLTKDQLNYIKLIINFGYGYKGHNDYKYYMASQELIWEYLNNIDITWTSILDINGPKINIDSYKNEILKLVNSYQNNLNIESNINCKVGEQIILTDTTNTLSHYNIISTGNQKAKIEDNKITIDINGKYIGPDEIKLERKKYYNHSSFLYYMDDNQKILSTGNTEDKIKTIKLNIDGETLNTTLIDMSTRKTYPQGEASFKGAVYELYDKNNQLIETFTTDETGKNSIKNLYHDTYYIKQIKASTGYVLNNIVSEITLSNTNNKIKLEQLVIKRDIEINKLYEVDNNYINEPKVMFYIFRSNNQIYTSFYTDYKSTKLTLPYGKYRIHQYTTTYGYDKIDDIIVTIDENTEPFITYTLKNNKLKTKLNILTKDKITEENIEEANIKYKIKNSKTGKYITYKDEFGNDIDIFTTNEKGQVLPEIELPYGEYELEQISPPKQYLENKEIISLTINEKTEYINYDGKLVLNIEIFNTKIIGNLNITTKEEKFIIEENNYQIKELIKPNTQIELYYEEKYIDNYITDDYGKLEIKNLELGNYCIFEKITNEKKCFELINYDNKTKIVEKNIIIKTKLPTTNVILNNKDNNQNPIKDTIIELYKERKLINTSLTNEDGIIKISNLSNGEYCFKQKQISNKYIINKEDKCFDITTTNEDINIIIINNIKETRKIQIPNTLSNNKNTISIIIILLIGVISYKKKNSTTNN